MTTTTVRSMCRICSIQCGILVTTDGDRILDIKPDPDHEVSRGYMCPKGRALQISHHAPDRLDHATIGRGTQRRQVTPEEVVDDLGQRLAKIRDEHGPDAIAFYYGGPTFADTAAGGLAVRFAKALGTRSVYSTTSLDSIARRTAMRLMIGRWPAGPSFDARRCNLLVLFGLNPQVSHGHTYSFPDPIGTIREIAARGEVWVFDPRRTESANHATRHVALRPGSDHAVLAYAIRELLLDGADEQFITQWTERVEVLREVVEPYTLEVAAEIADVEPTDLTDFVTAIRRAGRLSVLPGTGISFSPQCTVTEWLVLALHAVTGSIERPGGIWFNPGFWTQLDKLALAATPTALADEPAPGPRSRPDLESWLDGQHPAAGLSDEIEAGNVRALVVLGGNPLAMVPNHARVLEAYSNIEVLAVADVVDGDMTSVATHVFPAAAQLERADCNMAHSLQPEVFGQYTDAVLPLVADRRPMWWFIVEVARRLGIQVLPDAIDADPSDRAIIQHVIFPDPRLPFDEIAATPGGTLVEIDRQPWFTEHALPTKRWNLAPSRLVDQLRDIARPPTGLVLVSRRQRHHMNSIHREIALERHDEAALFVNPADAADRRLVDGGTAVVTTQIGSLTLSVRLDPTMRRGAVAVPHGFLSTNVNWITDDTDMLDPITGMPRFSTIPVTVEAG
ncbi:MAG: molybdopterin oxidoreductase [Actinomycetia bacterium]|nr:molybdopterin oxidoreductase [Actinomycetes bacterium]